MRAKQRGRPYEPILFLAGGFLEDPKIVALTPGEKLEWLRLLLEHVRYGNGSDLPGHGYGVSRRRLERFSELGLLDEEEGVLYVHGWDQWNGRDAYKRFLTRERVRRLRARRESDL
jgi:mannose/cellobiose epimerase-like protein (N-acyl-D-glucosamine 2-epimerase family)